MEAEAVNIKADKSFNIELNNLPDKEIELYTLQRKIPKEKIFMLQPTINGVVKTAKSFKITLSASLQDRQLRHHLRQMYLDAYVLRPVNRQYCAGTG